MRKLLIGIVKKLALRTTFFPPLEIVINTRTHVALSYCDKSVAELATRRPIENANGKNTQEAVQKPDVCFIQRRKSTSRAYDTHKSFSVVAS